MQCAKKEVPDSLGLVDFAIRLENSVLILADGQVKLFGKFQAQFKRRISHVPNLIAVLVD